jgi:hypothetical protein
MNREITNHEGEGLCALLRAMRTVIETAAGAERVPRSRMFELHQLATMAIELADRLADDPLPESG